MPRRWNTTHRGPHDDGNVLLGCWFTLLALGSLALVLVVYWLWVA